MTKEIYILGGARTPMTEYATGRSNLVPEAGLFKDLSAIDLGAIAAKAALKRTGVKPEEIEHTIMGNALQTSGDAIYGARHVGLKAGVPKEVPALTVNRLCGSGIQSVVSAAQEMLTGEARTILAGGMENMSQAPHVIWGARSGFRLGEGKLQDLLMVALMDTYSGCYMATTAENLSRKHGITREKQDEYALRSQKAAAAAYEKGYMKEEIVPVDVKHRGKPMTVDRDDHMKPDTTMEGLAKLPTAFSKDGFVTAGNASGVVDGAAALVVMEGSRVKENGAKPLARLVAWASVGVEPSEMGIGPVPAIRRVLEKAGLSLGQVDLLEINEAFAGQYLAVEKELGLDRDRVNINGGAIALGHPLAASGTRLLLTLGLSLRRTKGRYGIASACIGGGQGIAALIENVA
jgi:acetyl-CoA acetyltransferase family protein